MFPGMLGDMANRTTAYVPASEPSISGVSTIARVMVASLALAVLGTCMALAWREEPQPALAGGVHTDGARPNDYVLLALEKTARQNYCKAQGGIAIGEQALKCDFGLCVSGAADELCGVRVVVCDDVPDDHQCGLMGRAASAAEAL